MLVLFEARESGCFREVAALYSDCYRQVPLQHVEHTHTAGIVNMISTSINCRGLKVSD